MRTGTAVVIFLVLFAITAGCLQATPSPNPPAASPTGPMPVTVTGAGEPAAPSVLITSPPFDGGVTAGNVTVAVRVTGIILVPQGSGNRPGTGHLVYYLDSVPPVSPGTPAFPRTGMYAISSGTAFTWGDVTPGTHTFAVQLVRPDDSPFDPPVIDTVDVSAVGSAMGAAP